VLGLLSEIEGEGLEGTAVETYLDANAPVGGQVRDQDHLVVCDRRLQVSVNMELEF
jgi:hypothetical protein